MTKKIFSFSFLVGVLALLLCTGLFFGLQFRQNLDEAGSSLEQETHYVAQGIQQNGETYLENLMSDKHITWMDPDGNVRYDTHSAELPNQSDLTEVQEAKETGSGRAMHRSGSEGVMNLYYALRLSDGSIVRLSMPVSAIRSALITVSPVLWVFVLVLTISGVSSFRAARKIIRPINEMDLDHPEQSKIYPELSPLVTRLQAQKLTIDEQMETLHRRQKEFTALTDSMSEGFLLLDKDGKVLSANACARQLLPELAQGGETVACHETLAAAEVALEGDHRETDMQKNGRSWRLIANPVRSRGSVVGAVLLWMDITERAQRERLRQEFSANVSHENPADLHFRLRGAHGPGQRAPGPGQGVFRRHSPGSPAAHRPDRRHYEALPPGRERNPARADARGSLRSVPERAGHPEARGGQAGDPSGPGGRAGHGVRRLAAIARNGL